MAAAAKKAESKSDSGARPAKRDGYTVTAARVVAKNATGDAFHLLAGDVVPEGTKQESIDHLLDLGFIK